MRLAAARLCTLAFLVTCAQLPVAAPASAGPCAPVPDGLVGWWQMEGNAADVTSLHSGTISPAGGFYTAGEVGQGFHPVTGSLIVIPNAATLNPPQFTIDAWVKLDAIPSSNAGVLWKGSASGANSTSPFGLGIFGSVSNPPLAGRPYLTIGNGTLGQAVTTSTPLTAGTFFHLAATADGTTLRVYLNGAVVGSAAESFAPGPSAFQLQIGGLAGTSLLGFPGTIDEVEVHSQAASAAAIQAIFTAGTTGKCPWATPTRPTTWGRMKMLYR